MNKLTAEQRRRISWCVLGAVLFSFTQQGLVLLLAGPAGAGELQALLCSIAASGLSLWAALWALLALSPIQRADLKLKRLKPRRFFFALPLYFGLSVLLNLAAVRLQPYDASHQEPLPGGVLAVGLVLLLYCVIPAVGEELLFRGAMQGLLQPCGSKIAIFAPALLFGLLHARASQMFVAFGTGLFFGWLAMVTNGITTGIALHLLNNLVVVGQLYLAQLGDAALAAEVEMVYCLFWLAAAVVTLVAALLYGRHPRFHPAMPGPGLLRLFTAPAYTALAAILLALRVAEAMGVSL